MPVSNEQELIRQNPKWKSLMISCLASLISVFLTQFILFLLPIVLPTPSLIVLLPLSAISIVIVMGLGSCCKRIVGVRASAPAFVFFSISFTWVVYISVVRGVISFVEDILFNTEIVMVVIGLCCIMASDPGFVKSRPEVETHGEELNILDYDEQQESQSEEDCIIYKRMRFCKYCNTYVIGFDHHCPAFGNCIGQKNHMPFMVLLVGFLLSEVTYVTFACQFNAKSQSLSEVGSKSNISRCVVISTMLFSIIQVLWQVIFLMWHVYCACFNIKTDEWINWKKYPEFHTKTTTAHAAAGEPGIALQFVNPYNKGIIRNLKEFLTTSKIMIK